MAKSPYLMKNYGTDLMKIRSKSLRESIANGDSRIEDIVRNAARQIGIAIGNLVNLLLPDTIVMGGGLVEAMPDLFLRPARGRGEASDARFCGFLPSDCRQVGRRLGRNGRGCLGSTSSRSRACRAVGKLSMRKLWESGMLTGKVVVVTGSTTGIGKAVVEACVRQGANVVLHGRDRDRGEQLQQSLGDRAVFVADDLSDPDAADRIVGTAIDRFGRLDALVNNAAWVVRSDLDSTSVDLFDGVLAVNVRAPFLLIKAARPYLRETQGCIANIGSVNSLGGEQNLFAYSVSKGALLTLSKNLANALAIERIRIVHFNVGWVLTENEYHYKLADGLSPNWPDQLGPIEIPSGRMTRPDEIAEVISFWISDRTRPFSGTVMELEQFPFEGRNPTRTE